MAHTAQLIIPRVMSQTILEESRQESIEIANKSFPTQEKQSTVDPSV